MLLGMLGRASAVLLAAFLPGCSLIVPNPGDYTFGDDAGAMDAGLRDAGADSGADSGPPDSSSPEDAGGLPDLTIACPAPSDIMQQGDLVRLGFTAGNVGTRLGGPFTVAVEMERPAMMDGETATFVEMGTERVPTPVAPLGMAMGEVSFVAPEWVLGGTNQLRCIIDSADEVAEADESNNSDDALVIATGLPDLTPTSFFVSQSGFAPVTYDFTFTVRNDGVTAARSFVWFFGPNGPVTGRAMASVPYLGPGSSSGSRTRQRLMRQRSSGELRSTGSRP